MVNRMIDYGNVKIPILMYHKISKAYEKNRYTIEKKIFEDHLKRIKCKNYSTLDANEFYLNNRIIDKRNSVLITFDDGHYSDHEIVFPLLIKYNMKATFFVTTDWINTKGYMNETQIKELIDGGMMVQSHSKSHAFLNDLHEVELKYELMKSKEKLEHITGKEVKFLSFPGGRYNKKTIKIAKKAGYIGLFSSVPFFLKVKNGEKTMIIGRYGIKTNTSAQCFDNALDPKAFWVIKQIFKDKSIAVLKKILGNKIYYFAWKRYNEKSHN